jgi:hypothetical protein
MSGIQPKDFLLSLRLGYKEPPKTAAKFAKNDVTRCDEDALISLP